MTLFKWLGGLIGTYVLFVVVFPIPPVVKALMGFPPPRDILRLDPVDADNKEEIATDSAWQT